MTTYTEVVIGDVLYYDSRGGTVWDDGSTLWDITGNVNITSWDGETTDYITATDGTTTWA